MGLGDRFRGSDEAVQSGGGQHSRFPGPQYITEVNKEDINMRWLRGHLNERWEAGYRLHSMVEQGGNTILVFEKRGSV